MRVKDIIFCQGIILSNQFVIHRTEQHLQSSVISGMGLELLLLSATMSLVEQELLTLPEHSSSLSVLVGLMLLIFSFLSSIR